MMDHGPDCNRRRLLQGGAALLGFVSLDSLAVAIEAQPPAAVEPVPARPLAGLLAERRSLWLQRGDEELRATWWTAARGQDRDEYLKLCWLLRDVQANRVMPIDRDLLDLLAGIQAWLGNGGQRLPMRIHSGYRSARTNHKTEGAALNSKHVLGKAADISIPGVSNVTLAGISRVLGVGGTGFYVGRGFVHVDTGSERLWIDAGKRGAKPL
ncbi:MAG: DUF882 domain-containing protein [Burkholderiaceae bacterium]